MVIPLEVVAAARSEVEVEVEVEVEMEVEVEGVTNPIMLLLCAGQMPKQLKLKLLQMLKLKETYNPE